MERVLEPTELMDRPEQAAAYAGSDHTETHEAFVDRFAATFPTFHSDSRDMVADLCCGPADPTIRFARRFPNMRIIGFDGAESMLSLGREAVGKAGLEQRISFEKCMLPISAPPDRRFQVVICNGSMHHFEHTGVLWTTIKNIAHVGARVFVMDLTRPATMDDLREIVVNHTSLTDPVQMKVDFHYSLRAAYRPEEVRVQLDEAGLQHFRVEVVSNRHMAIWGKL